MQTNELMTELGSTITALMARGKGLLAAAATVRPAAVPFCNLAKVEKEKRR